MLNYLPSYFSTRAIQTYTGALLVVTLLFSSYAMEWYWMLFGLVEVFVFFHYGSLLTAAWRKIPSSRLFVYKLFWTAFIIRLIYVLFSYLFYQVMTGKPFEFEAADALGYDWLARLGAWGIERGDFGYNMMRSHVGRLSYSDAGYPLYLSVVYYLTDNSILLSRVVKALLSAWTCVLVYKLAGRQFGEGIGRMSAIFCMLMPNLIFYCGFHLKETEMVCLTVLFVERADLLIRKRTMDWWSLLCMFIVGICLFFFRTALGAVAFLSFFMTLLFTNTHMVRWGKRLVVGISVAAMFAIAFQDSISNEIDELWRNKSENQKNSMQWRATRANGNEYAKYMGAAFFMPMICTIPFPTMVSVLNQENQQMIHGGNYVKNITSAFTLFALFLLLYTGDWRKHVLPLAFMGGYLMVIALSAFAHSERFHLPALPFALIFAAYGIVHLEMKHIRWFKYWLIFIFVVIVVWNWFKLSGRGLV